MDRRKFVKNSLLGTGTILLSNAVWAVDGNNHLPNIRNRFLSVPNLKRFKVSDSGTRFFETELSIVKIKSKLKLHRKYFISENIEGYGTPTLLENSKGDGFIFVPELYKDNRHNGFIVKMSADGLCEETKIFTHENQGFYAFWGKQYRQHPTLYHYNIETLHLMRAHWENGRWVNNKVMPLYPNEMLSLYKQQLKQLAEPELQQQFGYDFDIHKDGFYQFLSLKRDWEQVLSTKEKEDYERENPAKIYTDPVKVSGTHVEGKTFSYTNPFIPVYCKGDDLSHAIIKPSLIYEEVMGSKIEIANMPAYKTQDDIGDCKAFSLATLLQHYTCQKWKSDIPDCKNPPADSAISYFGLMVYTNRSVNEDYTFQPNQKKGVGMDEIINNLSNSGVQLILENCKPFENLVRSFSSIGAAGLVKRDEFFNYLKSAFERLKSTNEINVKDCRQEVATLNTYVDLKFNEATFKKALTKSNFDQFLYVLFFSECRREVFPPGFSAAAYPLDSMNVDFTGVKNQVLKGLKYGKPVLCTSICVSQSQGNECEMGHSLVISGYKKVKNADITKDVFKIHNSWGEEWQKKNNDGWVDADALAQNNIKVKTEDGKYRIGSASVIWLDP